MLETTLAPYLYWAKTRETPPIDLAGSNLLHCSLDELPGAREALDLSTPNGDGYQPLVAAIAAHYGVSADRVTTAPGCSGANFVAIAALVAAGDEVLVGSAFREGFTPTSYRNNKGSARAYDVRSGKKLWEFHTIPRKGEPGYDTWLNNSADTPSIFCNTSIIREQNYGNYFHKKSFRRIIFLIALLVKKAGIG